MFPCKVPFFLRFNHK